MLHGPKRVGDHCDLPPGNYTAIVRGRTTQPALRWWRCTIWISKCWKIGCSANFRLTYDVVKARLLTSF